MDYLNNFKNLKTNSKTVTASPSNEKSMHISEYFVNLNGNNIRKRIDKNSRNY